jgi:hypothetical protein
VAGTDGIRNVLSKAGRFVLWLAGAATEYYDLSADPGEQRPLPLDEEGKRLRTRLLGWLDERDVSRERGAGGRPLFGDRADLRALGYM